MKILRIRWGRASHPVGRRCINAQVNLQSASLVALLAFGVAMLAVLFYLGSSSGGQSGWDAYRKELQARGVNLSLNAYIPPPVPDEQNFAQTPFLAPLFDFLPGTQTARDSNAFSRCQGFASNLPSIDGGGDWRLGKPADLPLWITEYREQRDRTKVPRVRSTPTSTPTPAPELSATNAAAEVLAVLREYEPVLNELRSASQRPQARFNIKYDYSPIHGVLLPHLSLVKKACQILRIKAQAELALHQPEAAFADLELLFRLGDTIKSEPFLISHLVHWACFQIGVQVWWEGLATQQWNDAQLRTLQQRLEQADFLDDARRALQGERAMGDLLIEQIIRDPRLLAQIGDFNGSTPDDLGHTVMRLIPKGWLYQERMNYHRLFEVALLNESTYKLHRISPREVEQKSKAFTAELEAGNPVEKLWKHQLLAGLLIPALTNVERKGANVQVVCDQALIAGALERYRQAKGAFPDTLASLVPGFLRTVPPDVITGEPYTYRRTEEGRFVLFSVGWNETDDGGQPGLGRSKKPTWDMNQGDWVWTYPPKP